MALEVAPIDVLSYHHVPLVLWTYCPMTTSPMALMPYRHQSYHKSVLSPTVLSLFCPIAASPIALLHYRRQSHRQIRYQVYRYYRLLPVSVLSDGPVIIDNSTLYYLCCHQSYRSAGLSSLAYRHHSYARLNWTALYSLGNQTLRKSERRVWEIG